MLAALDDADVPPAAATLMIEYFTTASAALINS
jgi:hypothetical protein